MIVAGKPCIISTIMTTTIPLTLMICLSGKDSDGERNVTLHKKLKINQFHVTKQPKDTVCDFGEQHTLVISFVRIFISFLFLKTLL